VLPAAMERVSYSCKDKKGFRPYSEIVKISKKLIISPAFSAFRKIQVRMVEKRRF